MYSYRLNIRFAGATQFADRLKIIRRAFKIEHLETDVRVKSRQSTNLLYSWRIMCI